LERTDSKVEIKFSPIAYRALNARQKEAFNFQKVSAVLADYGYITIRLSSDWGGADFIAQHRDGEFLKVQLKGRLTFDKKYEGFGLHICFPERDGWFIYPHDELLQMIMTETGIAESDSWKVNGGYSFPTLSKQLRSMLKPYRLAAEKARGIESSNL